MIKKTSKTVQKLLNNSLSEFGMYTPNMYAICALSLFLCLIICNLGYRLFKIKFQLKQGSLIAKICRSVGL